MSDLHTIGLMLPEAQLIIILLLTVSTTCNNDNAPIEVSLFGFEKLFEETLCSFQPFTFGRDIDPTAVCQVVTKEFIIFYP